MGMPSSLPNGRHSGIPIIRVENLNGSEDFNYYDGEVEQRYLVHDGDLLFGWSGNRGQIGLRPFSVEPKRSLCLKSHIFRVCSSPRAEKRSLFWTLKGSDRSRGRSSPRVIGMVHVTKCDLVHQCPRLLPSAPTNPDHRFPRTRDRQDRRTGGRAAAADGTSEGKTPGRHLPRRHERSESRRPHEAFRHRMVGGGAGALARDADQEDRVPGSWSVTTPCWRSTILWRERRPMGNCWRNHQR